MITWYRTYSASMGKLNDVIKLSQEAVEHLKKTYGLEVQLYTQISGDPNRVGLLGRYNDVGDVGKLQTKIADDSKWATIMTKAGEVLVEGSLRDEFWKEV